MIRTDNLGRLVILTVASTLIASQSNAQLSPVPVRNPPWADTTGESPIYPVGDAIPVYRAVLDLLYLDGDKRPPIIVMHDTAEGRTGGPCAFVKCIGPVWKHRAKIDTATLLGFARMSPKRPRIREFGYPIPIAFISFDDVRRMRADGTERIANRPPPQYPSMMAGFWAELARKYPGAWGVTHISKVGFNPRHTQAMVSVRQWCGENCVSDESLFLRKTAGRWRVVERIPNEIDVSRSSSGSLRYVGPMVRDAKETEIITPDRRGTPTEASARANVYRLVLDSLYSFHGEHPRALVLTDGAFGGWFDTIPAHQSVIDPAVTDRFRLVHTIRVPLDTRPRFHIPIATLPADSLASLKERGVALDAVAGTGSPLWLAFSRRFPRAWGMVSLSRIAFNSARSQALVTTTHVCGEQCYNTDIWFLTRSGRTWQIAERIPTPGVNGVEIEPLRYIGLDADPNAYRPRRVRGLVTDENGKPLPNLVIRIRRLLMNSGVNVDDPPIHTDSAGHYTLTNLPLNGALTMLVPCPGPQKREGQPSVAQVQPIGVMAGMDTTVNMLVDFRICDPAAAEARVAENPLSGAKAFITADEARFVFPVQSTEIYEWDVPRQGAYAGGAEYMWDVHWDVADSSAGKIPQMLWLVKSWKPGGPHQGSLKQLIAGVRLGAMIACLTCDPSAFFEDDETDHASVFATVEDDQLIFVVRGADAVRRVFPRIPATVTFSQTLRHTPGTNEPAEVSSSLEVMVSRQRSP